jgi:hypothetical protein
MGKTNTGNGKVGRREGDMKLYIANEEKSCWKFFGHHTRMFLISICRMCVLVPPSMELNAQKSITFFVKYELFRNGII